MVDVRGDVLRPPHGTTPAAVKSNIKSEMRSFKCNENIHKKEGTYGTYSVQNYIHMTNLLYILMTKLHTHDKLTIHTHDKTTYT